MKEQFSGGQSKLTASSGRGYDRGGAYMSEHKGDTTTAPREQATFKEPSLADLSQAQHRQAKEQMRGLGVPKRKLMPSDVAKELMMKRDLADIEKRLMSMTSENREKMKGQSYVSAEVIRNRKDWREYGWDDEGKERVKQRLMELFGWDEKKNAGQIKTTLEILLSKGKTPDELLGTETLEGMLTVDKLREAEMRANVHVPTELILLADEDFLDIREEYVMRFILPEQFKAQNHSLFQETPRNIEDLAWQISHTDPGKWGVNGKYPVLEMRIEKNADTGRAQGRYYINQANVLRFQRERAMEIYGNEPDNPHNFFQEVELKKELRGLSLMELYYNKATVYRSEDENLYYDELYTQSMLEAWYMTTLRTWDVEMKKIEVIGSDEKSPQTIAALFANNALTKNALSKNLLYFMATTPLNLDVTKPGEFEIKDNTLGAAYVDMYLAYYHISDLEKLQEILGKDSSFFTRQGIESALFDVWRDKQKQTGEVVPTAFLNDATKEALQKAFDKDGKIKDQKEFTTLINLFQAQNLNANLTKAIRIALKNAAKERHGFTTMEKGIKSEDDERALEDGYSLEMAELMAFSMVRFTAAGAKNDTGVAGYDALTKMTDTEQYRYKMLDGRAGGTGNLKTIPLFKRVLVDPFQAIMSEATTQAEEYDHKTGTWKKVYTKDKEGKTKPVMRRKTALEVFLDVQRVRSAQLDYLKQLQSEYENAPADKKAHLLKELGDAKYQMNWAYQQVAAQFDFKENAMRYYVNDHLARAQKLYKMIMDAEELKFDKFVKYDTIRGVTFDRAEFQKTVLEQVFKPARYAFSTFAELNFNQKIRARKQIKNEKGKMEWKYVDMPLGEALFGYQLLNRKEFWAVGEHGEWLKDSQGRHAIDYNKVQTSDGKKLLWRTWVLVKIGADLQTHRDLHMTDPGYNFTFYQDALNALQEIPGAISGDENDMTKTKVTKKFFSKDDMKWLKGMIKVEWWDLYNREFWSTLLMPKGDKKQGVGAAFMKQVLAGLG